MIDQSVIDQGKKFEEMSREVLPLVIQIEEILKKHGVSAIASITTNVTTGYFTFSTHENEWEMVRSSNECKVKIRYEFSEEFDLEDEDESTEPTLRERIYGKEEGTDGKNSKDNNG